ncbi:MAG TPA: nucleotidyltransferase family protein [Candidatus Polarisedimenticolaceae bacterium]|nr:nucleotidyltransferase family protein [Candidatus Polarisedimenticolaceae bacterium]
MSPLLAAKSSSSPELAAALVAASLRPELRGDGTPYLELLERGDGLAELLDAAAQHGVLGLTLSTLLDALRRGIDRPPAALEVRFEDLRRRSSMLELKCALVVSLLERARVNPVVLKGAAIALRHYPEPWQRDLADLDLLVRPHDVDAALATLAAAGYRSPVSPARDAYYRAKHFHLPVVHGDGHYVEIHWALTRPDSGFGLDPESVYWSAERVTRQGGAIIRIPRVEHTMLHIVVQNLQEGFSRLGRTVDIDRIVASTPRLDWDQLVAEARRGNLGSATALSLQLAARLMHTPVPDEVRRALLPPPVARFHLALMRPELHLLSRRVTRIRAAEDLLELWLLNVARRRFGLLASNLRRFGAIRGAIRVAKISALQLLFYAGALLPGTSRSARAFWSFAD